MNPPSSFPSSSESPRVVIERRPVPRPAPLTPDEERVVALVQPQVREVLRPGLADAVKRGIDMAGAVLGLFLLAPLLLGTALAIRIESRGPVLFTQTRVGRGGRLFRIYKFRSMVIDAEARKAALAARSDMDGASFKMRLDPRVTKIGRLIRKFSVDELPQLLNVFLGDMSLVGPRPVPTAEVLRYEPWQMRRLLVTPGLTCIWQVSGRSNISFEQWMRMDLDYIDRWSIGLDLALILRTIKVVVTGDGAY